MSEGTYFFFSNTSADYRSSPVRIVEYGQLSLNEYDDDGRHKQ